MTTLHSLPEPAEPTAAARSRIAKFGVFELDLSSGELRRSGVRVPLQDQPVRLLALLLERAGEVVTREEVRTQLWPSEFVDFDHSLNTAVRKLRSALDDSADNPRFVETLARRGYRFIAPVTWNRNEHADATPDAVVTPSQALRPALLAATAAVVAIVAIIGAIAFFRRPAPKPVAAKTIDSIAVLPFWNGDRDTQHVNDGLTEILIDTMSRVPNLRVMATTTVFHYKDVDPRKAGKELGVAAVVDGSIHRENDRYSVRVELIDVKDGAQLWSSRYEASTAELPALQGRIAGDLATVMRRGGTTSTAISASTSPEVYELYTKGLYAWNRRSQKDLDQALEYFNAAVTRDPNFAPGYAGLANTYGVMVGYGSISAAQGTAMVMANAQKALDLDPNNAEALVSLATNKYRSIWDFPGAGADYKRALALNPNYATGHEWYSDYLRSMGHWDEARREIDTAYKLDPFSPAITTMECFAYYYERRYREAIDFAAKAAKLDPRFSAPLCTSDAYAALGDYKGVADVMRTSAGAGILVADHASAISKAYDEGGPKAMLKKWSEVLAGCDPSIRNPVHVAIAYARMGDREGAFKWLEKAYDQRISIITNINIEPELEPLHSDPRWDDLLKRIGLPKVDPPKS